MLIGNIDSLVGKNNWLVYQIECVVNQKPPTGWSLPTISPIEVAANKDIWRRGFALTYIQARCVIHWPRSYILTNPIQMWFAAREWTNALYPLTLFLSSAVQVWSRTNPWVDNYPPTPGSRLMGRGRLDYQNMMLSCIHSAEEQHSMWSGKIVIIRYLSHRERPPRPNY